MIFDRDTIARKVAALDELNRRSLSDVAAELRQFFGPLDDLRPVPRAWSPGGGASLFTATHGGRKVFVKIKEKTLGVESRLESEAAIPARGALLNEVAFCTLLADEPEVPRLAAHAQNDRYCMALFESLVSFDEGIARLNAYERYLAYEKIEALVRRLFAKGIVHTDIHEKNILFRDGQPVLCDFEEARFLRQDVSFAQSLDMVGKNQYGDVGEFPDGFGHPGLTCLTRLKSVFKNLIKDALPALLQSCHFSNDCPFNADTLQGVDERIYQSIDLGDRTYAGQRPLKDKRHGILERLLSVLRPDLGDGLRVVDMGSNLGNLSFVAAAHPAVAKVIGLEAFPEYVQVSRLVGFLLDHDKAEFAEYQAGAHPLPDGPIDLLMLFSVYHHVRAKDAFLADLARHRPRAIVAEMAVQERYYDTRGGLEAELKHIQAQLGYKTLQLIGHTSDYQRPICLLSDGVPLPNETKAYVMQGTGSPLPPAAKPTAPITVSTHGGVKVSVVLPTYNHATYLPVALHSVLNQTFDDFELIVVNDGSTDGTAALLAGIQHPKLRVINKDNGKLPAALNTGFAAARGEYFTWTSADNIVAPNWLNELVTALDSSPRDVGYALSHYATIDDADRITSICNDQCFETHRLLIKNGNASFLYRAELARKVGGYDPELLGAEDLDLWLRMSMITRAVLVESVLYYYRVHGASMTAQIPEKIVDATRRTYLKFLDSNGGKLNVDRLFPNIGSSVNPAAARWQARVWLTGRLAGNRDWPVETLVDLLSQCLAEQYTAGLVGNVVHLYASRNGWSQAADFVSRFHQADQTDYMRALSDVVTRRDHEALQKIPFLTCPDTVLSFNPRTQLSRSEISANSVYH